jgi:hypothetical protein
MAEIEIRIFERQRSGRRIANVDTLRERISALGAERNGLERNGLEYRIHRRHTTEQARDELQALYPALRPTYLALPDDSWL